MFKNVEDIRIFVAKVIVGQGTIFKPMSKQDLLAWARYTQELEERINNLLKMNEPRKGLFMGKLPQEQEDPVQIKACNSANEELMDGVPYRTDEKIKDAEVYAPEPCYMTRREEFAQEGKTAQEAYDEFKKWEKAHPHESIVMDFSTGKKHEAAAFAYWLTDPTICERA